MEGNNTDIKELFILYRICWQLERGPKSSSSLSLLFSLSPLSSSVEEEDPVLPLPVGERKARMGTLRISRRRKGKDSDLIILFVLCCLGWLMSWIDEKMRRRTIRKEMEDFEKSM
jgi:hypothetical protein